MQKILAGKTTIGSLFSKGSKEDKLAGFEKQIAAVNKLLKRGFRAKITVS